MFKDKPGGFIVDYLGVVDQLERSLAIYTESGGANALRMDSRKKFANVSFQGRSCHSVEVNAADRYDSQGHGR